MKKSMALFIALFVYLGALFAPAMGASLLDRADRSPSDVSSVTGKKSQKKCKKLKKKIKKAKSKKAKKKAKKKYNKKCKCKKLKKKAKKAKSPKKRKKAQRKYNKKCTSGGGSGSGSGGGGGGGGGTGGGGGGGTPPPGTERPAEGTYTGPVVGVAGLGYVCGGGCVTFSVGASESYVSVEIIDDSGQPAGAALAQDVDGDGVGDIFGAVCGKTDAPIQITPGLELNVAVGAGFVFDAGTLPPGACPSVATTGTVKTIFSSTP